MAVILNGVWFWNCFEVVLALLLSSKYQIIFLCSFPLKNCKWWTWKTIQDYNNNRKQVCNIFIYVYVCDMILHWVISDTKIIIKLK